MAQANTLAQCYGWTLFVALQVEYSLIERTPERDLIPMAQAFDMAVTPWSPLAGGILTSKYNRNDGQQEEGSRGANINDRKLKIAEFVAQVAQEIGRSPSQVALAWLRARGNSTIPIIGARKLSQIQDNLACVEIMLSPEHLQRLNEVSGIELGFPHDFLQNDMIRDRLYGGTYNAIDNHHRYGMMHNPSLETST